MGRSGAVIANGASQSQALEIFEQAIIGIQMSPDWTAAQLTLLASSTETGVFDPVYDAAGDEVVIEAAADRYITLDPAGLRFRFLKLRSGTSAAPVNQGAERKLEVVFGPSSV